MDSPPVPIVITGFGKFGGVPDNPSSTLVKAIISNTTPTNKFKIIQHAILDTSVEGAKELQQLQKLPASFHLHLGVHGGAKQIHVESQAFNQDDFRIPDNNGVQLKNHTIAEGCPEIYQTSIDVCTLVERLGEGYCVSNDPGRFLCNHVFFQSLRWCATCDGTKHCLFVHVPPFSVVSFEDQYQLILKLLNTLCSDFNTFAKGRPTSKTLVANNTNGTEFAPSVNVNNVNSSNEGEKKTETTNPTIPQAVLDFGFTNEQIILAISMLPVQYQSDSQRIIECIMTMSGDSIEEERYTSAADAYKMVLLVRKDLKMGVGKIAAQCCHAAVGACRQNVYQDWMNQGEAKIVLSVKNLTELKKYCDLAREAGLPVVEIQDAGRTEVAPGTITVAAIGPGKIELIDSVTGKLRLLK